MMKPYSKPILALLFAGPLFAAALNGQALMMNFRDSGGPTGSNLTNSPLHSDVAGFSETTWNNVRLADMAAGSLLYADGSTASTVGMNLGSILDSTSGSTIDLSTNPDRVSNLGSQTNTGIYSGDSVGTGGIFYGTSSQGERGVGLQLTGLAAGTYDLYISGRNTNSTGPAFPLDNVFYAGVSAASGNFDYSGYSSSTIDFVSNTDATSSWIMAGNANENYAKFTVSLTDGDVLNIASVGSARGFLNSVHLVAVPEPGAYASVFGGIALGLIVLRRRKGTTNL